MDTPRFALEFWPDTEFAEGDRVMLINAPHTKATVCKPDGYGGILLEWDADEDGGPYEDEVEPDQIVKITPVEIERTS